MIKRNNLSAEVLKPIGGTHDFLHHLQELQQKLQVNLLVDSIPASETMEWNRPDVWLSFAVAIVRRNTAGEIAKLQVKRRVDSIPASETLEWDRPDI